MKHRSLAEAGLSETERGTEVVGRAAHDRQSLDQGQIWKLAATDEPIADRLLSLGIAGVGGFVDGGRDGACVWLVRKLAAETLADKIRDKRGAWAAAEALAVGISMARALAACERLSLFAGAIAPETTQITGTSCAFRAERLVRSMVGGLDGGSALGTEVSPKWTPPAQADGAVWDSAANRYVVGLVMYRLLGGEHPFSGAGLRHALSEAAGREAPPFVESVARDLPAGLQSFVLRMLSPDVSARPANSQEIAEKLSGFLRGDDGRGNHALVRNAEARRPSEVLRNVGKEETAPQKPVERDEKPAEARRKNAGGPAIGGQAFEQTNGKSPLKKTKTWLSNGRLLFRFLPLAAGVGSALLALSLLGPPAEKPKTVTVGQESVLRAEETTSQECAKCHARQASEWRRSVMAHAMKSPLFNALEMAIEEQFGRDFDCPNGAGALRRADSATACKVQQTGLLLTGTGGEHWCISCHGPSENLEKVMPAWDGRPGGDPRTRRPPRDMLGERALEGISCGFCHQVHGPVGPRGQAGYQGNPTWTSPFTGTSFASRPEDGRGLFGIANSGYDLRPEELLLSGGGASGGGVRRPGGSPQTSASAGATVPGTVDPIVHARPSKTASSYLASSEFCGSCHDVRLFGTDVIGATKGEHFKRLRNAYSEWVDWTKGEARAGRPTSTCQDCHMSTFPGVCEPAPENVPAVDSGAPARKGQWEGICPPGTKFASRKPGSYPKAVSAGSSPEALEAVTHYFSGVDVPLSREYPEALVDEGSLDVHGIPLSAKKRRDMLLRASFQFDVDRPRRAGNGLEIPVVVENVGAGHKVPAGFSQEREFWVHLVVRDANGGVVYEVGRVNRGDEDLRDKVFLRVNVSESVTDFKGRPLGMFGADVADGPDHPTWDPPPALGGTRFRGRGLINFQNGFLRCVRCIGLLAPDGSCNAGPGQGAHRADRFDDGDYDVDTGECRSNLAGQNALFETFFPVGALDASRGVLKGPDAIIDTRSLPPHVPITYTYTLGTGGRPGPFRVEARLLFRAFPPFLVRGFVEYEREQARKGLRPSGPLVTSDMLKRLEIVEVARVTTEVP